MSLPPTSASLLPVTRALLCRSGHAASAAPQASSPPDYTMAWAEYYRQQVAFYGQTLGQAQAHSQVCSRSPALPRLPRPTLTHPTPPRQAFCVCLTPGPGHGAPGLWRNRLGPGTAQHGRRLQSALWRPPWPPPRPRQDKFEPSGGIVWAAPTRTSLVFPQIQTQSAVLSGTQFLPLEPRSPSCRGAWQT